MYSLIRRLLFLLDAETAHVVSLKLLSLVARIGLLRLFIGRTVYAPVKLMGIEFPNSVGLAAGLDKNARHIDALSQCGFGFIEVGTVTPLAQPGNDKPRLFRLVADEAIINRMGFNNDGVDVLLENVKRCQRNSILGINIGKNKATPLDKAVDDYLVCMQKVYACADYITINISSPNTPGLRELQHGEGLSALLNRLKSEQALLTDQSGHYVPLLVKIAPDLNEDEIADISRRLIDAKIDGVIATNTTNSRPTTLKEQTLANETGGLSGRPLLELSNQVLSQLVTALDGAMPVIAVGGIFSAEDARAKIAAGASLVQVYTGFIYSGPALIRACAKALRPL
jgi:dihydroorotate dehydrogenase